MRRFLKRLWRGYGETDMQMARLKVASLRCCEANFTKRERKAFYDMSKDDILDLRGIDDPLERAELLVWHSIRAMPNA